MATVSRHRLKVHIRSRQPHKAAQIPEAINHRALVNEIRRKTSRDQKSAICAIPNKIMAKASSCNEPATPGNCMTDARRWDEAAELTLDHPSEGDCGAILEVAADDLRADREAALAVIIHRIALVNANCPEQGSRTRSSAKVPQPPLD